MKTAEEIDCPTFNSEWTYWMEKKFCQRKRGVLILGPNQGVLKNEQKQSHFGLINKILYNFQLVKFMISFKLTILWRKKQKEKSSMLILGEKWLKTCLKWDRLRLLCTETKGVVFSGGYSAWFWLCSVCTFKNHPPTHTHHQ